MMCQIVASIVDTAQVVDQFIAKKSTYGTFALSFQNYSMSAVGWDGSSCPIVHDKFEPEAYCDPFEADEYGYVISIGYVITLVCFLPLGLLNFKVCVVCMSFFYFFILPDYSIFFIDIDKPKKGKCSMANILLHHYIRHNITVYNIFLFI